MSSLIKNEITKVLKKKSIYIMLIIILAIIILSNALYKYTYDSANNGHYSKEYIKTLEENIKTLNPENIEEVDEYIADKTDIEIYNLLKQYNSDSWQYEVIQEKGANYISQINYYTYKDKNDEELDIVKQEYNKFLERLSSDDWRAFAQEELETAKQEKSLTPENSQNNMLDLQIETLQMRLDYNIKYGNNYKNKALFKYLQNKVEVLEYEAINNKTYQQKISYQEVKENMEKSKYAIENDKDIFNKTNARGILLDVFTEYEIFIIITVVLIAGAIVSEEFNKGTIKLLLVRPYKRTKILFAKFITVLITVVFIMIAIGIIQFVVGSIFFGFESLKIPAIEYNHNTGNLVETNILTSVVLQGLGKLPIYVLIGTLAFALSTLFTNTAVAITISLLGHMASSLVNQFAYYYKIAWIKYFVTPNWDITQFYHGKLPMFEGLNIPFSLVICLIYFMIMMIPTFIVFKKKNIKNI